MVRVLRAHSRSALPPWQLWALPLAGCVVLAGYMASLCLSVFICKMQIILVSLGVPWKALRAVPGGKSALTTCSVQGEDGEVGWLAKG